VSFIAKIKYEYHKRILDDLKSQSKPDEFINELLKISNKEAFFKLSEENISEIFKTNSQLELLKSKIVWINSFFQEDLNILDDFIYFYFKNYYPDINENSNYENLIHQFYSLYQNNQNPPEDYIIMHSYLLQWLILKDHKKEFYFIKNRFSFFSNDQNFNFSNRALSRNYLFLVDHPYRVYQDIKDKFGGDQEVAKNIFLNLDQSSEPLDVEGFKYHIPQNGWLNHAKSWLDLNVIDSLKGLIIQKENLIDNPSESLTKIIMHLIQGGLKIDLSYDLIDQYIEKKKLNNIKLNPITISNNEKKFLSKYLAPINELIDYEL